MDFNAEKYWSAREFKVWVVTLHGPIRRGRSTRDVKYVRARTEQGAHLAEVRAFLIKYYGSGCGQNITEPLHTITTKDRLGLVTVAGDEYQIFDIGMRMLTPRELYRAQGFPDRYIIDPEVDGKTLSKAHQVRMCGNSVSPPNAAALVAANFVDKARRAVA